MAEGTALCESRRETSRSRAESERRAERALSLVFVAAAAAAAHRPCQPRAARASISPIAKKKNNKNKICLATGKLGELCEHGAHAKPVQKRCFFGRFYCDATLRQQLWHVTRQFVVVVVVVGSRLFCQLFSISRRHGSFFRRGYATQKGVAKPGKIDN